MHGREFTRTKWDLLREQLGLRDARGCTHTRAWVAEQLGLGRRTLERYELSRAPQWYPLALLGLATQEKKKKR